MTKKIAVIPIDSVEPTQELREKISTEREDIIPGTTNKMAQHILTQIQNRLNIYYDVNEADNTPLPKGARFHLNEIMHVLKDYEQIETTPLT